MHVLSYYFEVLQMDNESVTGTSIQNIPKGLMFQLFVLILNKIDFWGKTSCFLALILNLNNHIESKEIAQGLR